MDPITPKIVLQQNRSPGGDPHGIVPQRAPLVLGGIALLLMAAGAIAAAIDLHAWGGLVGKQFVDLFHLDREHSVPAWFTSMLLISAAILAWLVGRTAHPHARRHYWAWRVLAIGFAVLSMDEAASIHERLGRLGALVVDTRGVFTFAWVAVALPAVVFLGVLYLRFLRDLPAPHRGRLVVAAGCYLGGVIGFEMLDGAVGSSSGYGALYWTLVVIEEGVEMLGAILAVRAFGLLLDSAGPTLDRPFPLRLRYAS